MSLSNVIIDISPIETPFFSRYTKAEKTIIRFSGNDRKVMQWAGRRANKRSTVEFEWGVRLL